MTWIALKEQKPERDQLIVLRYRNCTSTQRYREQDEHYYYSWSMEGGKDGTLFWMPLNPLPR